ncbi:MAG: hypothetical protein HYZ23_07885, partial [Chloroflexi bacterium]|nr:hypothetical protein [Chloroflexota bacterium]
VTVISGKARLQAGEEILILEKFQTALIPACLGNYQLQPLGDQTCRALKSSA